MKLIIVKKQTSNPPTSLPLGYSLTLLPLDIILEQAPSEYGNADAEVKITYEDRTERFLAVYKPNWNRSTFENAIRSVQMLVDTAHLPAFHPLILLPYLTEEYLNTLAERQVSGLDLCGNGVVTIPGRWFIMRSGCPNRFRIDQELRNPYKGLSSLVPRTLLRRPVFEKLEGLHHEIQRRGGHISLALVSRSLKRLEADLLVLPLGARVRLVQSARLIDRLVERSEPVRVTHVWRGRIPLPMDELLIRLFANAKAQRVRVVMTGIGSASRHTSMMMEEVVYLYANQVEPLLEGVPPSRGERFANLEIRVPRDEVVYFDAEEEGGIVWASPVQTYLEMKQSTDVRLHEGAEAIRVALLEALQSSVKETL